MLDIRLIRENPDLIKQRLANRSGDHASLVDQVLEIDTQRRSAETERQKLQSEINELSAKRQTYITEEQKKAGQTDATLGTAVIETVRVKAQKEGFTL